MDPSVYVRSIQCTHQSTNKHMPLLRRLIGCGSPALGSHRNSRNNWNLTPIIYRWPCSPSTTCARPWTGACPSTTCAWWRSMGGSRGVLWRGEALTGAVCVNWTQPANFSPAPAPAFQVMCVKKSPAVDNPAAQRWWCLATPSRPFFCSTRASSAGQ